MDLFAEAISGLLLLSEYQTRIASFLIMCAMLVATFIRQINNGVWNCIATMGFLQIAMFCLILGSGRFDIDYLRTKNNATSRKLS
ncbi:DoxX family protein [Flavobacterium sp. RSP49]|nr:DoxX family protein [Flavobacterium sp. RSP49]